MITEKNAPHFSRGWFVPSLRSGAFTLAVATWHAPRHAVIGLIVMYRWTLGIVIGGRCKYHPSCSQYALDALREYGFLKGSILAGWRLLRCNPWSHGGVDYAEDQKLFA